MRASLVLLCSWLVVGCGDDPSQCERKDTLVDHHDWTFLPPAQDPFRVDSPDGGTPKVVCSTAAQANFEIFGGEESFTVYTRGECSWVTLEQPALIDVAEGEPLFLRIFYFSQATFDPAQARVLIAFDDQIAWSTTVPLPTTSGLLYETISAPRRITPTTRVRWHLDNHGDNSWNILELSVTRSGPCTDDLGV
jgi:hypothetical protein